RRCALTDEYTEQISPPDDINEPVTAPWPIVFGDVDKGSCQLRSFQAGIAASDAVAQSILPMRPGRPVGVSVAAQCAPAQRIIEKNLRTDFERMESRNLGGVASKVLLRRPLLGVFRKQFPQLREGLIALNLLPE